MSFFAPVYLCIFEVQVISSYFLVLITMILFFINNFKFEKKNNIKPNRFIIFGSNVQIIPSGNTVFGPFSQAIFPLDIQ